MHLYHHQTTRCLHENDRSMWYLLEDSYRTTTYHFVVDASPPLWVHTDQRIIVKATDQFHFPFSTHHLHRLENHVANHRYATIVIRPLQNQDSPANTFWVSPLLFTNCSSHQGIYGDKTIFCHHWWRAHLPFYTAHHHKNTVTRGSHVTFWALDTSTTLLSFFLT